MNGVVRCPNCGAANRVRPSRDGVPRCGRCKSLLPWITSATESTFEAEVQASVPVIVDFWAPWCGPCRVLEPLLEKLAAEHAGELKVVRVDVDEQPELARRRQALSIPLLLVLRDGEEVDRIAGAVSFAELERRLRPVLDAGRQTVGSRG